MKMKLLSVAALLAAGAVAMPAVAGVTLDNVKKRGHVLCGVNTSAPGFSSADSQGKWRGLDVNICRSVAAAVLGDADKVKLYADILYNQALLMAGLPLEDPVAYANEVAKLMA